MFWEGEGGGERTVCRGGVPGASGRRGMGVAGWIVVVVGVGGIAVWGSLVGCGRAFGGEEVGGGEGGRLLWVCRRRVCGGVSAGVEGRGMRLGSRIARLGLGRPFVFLL